MAIGLSITVIAILSSKQHLIKPLEAKWTGLKEEGPALSMKRLEEYLSSIYGKRAKIRQITELGVKKTTKELKGFGYGIPYLIRFELGKDVKEVVLETVRSDSFGHEHFSDRAQILLWQHSAFNKLPGHVRSVDVGAFTVGGALKSLGDCSEFFILTEVVKGRPYHVDLDDIKKYGEIAPLDLDRCEALADYLVKIHSVKREDPGLYVRRVRELLGHGECIMGVIDGYPSGLSYVDEKCFCDIEKLCVEWRWRLKRKTSRLCQVHGDYHPWNVLFREETDFTVLDRSRGEWGEPADDVSAMTINYIFYSLQTYGELKGPFKDLFDLFWSHYLSETGDEEMLTVIQPFYAWRALVIASPVWYPNLPLEVRVKLFNFVLNVLKTEEFNLDDVNSYLKG